MTSNIPTKRAHLCSFCGPGITHIIDPIDYPNDTYAHPDNLGRWKCGTCIEREIQDKIVKVTPNSDRAKEIITERADKQKKEIDFKKRESEIKQMRGQRLKI